MRNLRRFLQCESGFAFAYFAVTLPVMLGIVLLVIDVSRANNLESDLQKYADALAVAGAAELNGAEDTTARVEAAIENLVENQARFGDEPSAVGSDLEVAYRCLTDIPPDDDPLWPTAAQEAAGKLYGKAFVVEDCKDATYVAVWTQPVTYSLLFPLVSQTSVQVRTEAVAGYGRVACKITPLFICNPFYSSGVTTNESMQTFINSEGGRKRMVEIRRKGGNEEQWSEGNFGYLTTPDGDMSAKTLRERLALGDGGYCYDDDGVDLRPGQVTSTRAYLNSRFDMYESGAGGLKGKAGYGPAKNVRKGMRKEFTEKIDAQTGNVVTDADGNPVMLCSYTEVDYNNLGLEGRGFMKMPPDDCVKTNSCTKKDPETGDTLLVLDENGDPVLDSDGNTIPQLLSNGRVGDGNYPVQLYWDTNFPGIAVPEQWADENDNTQFDPAKIPSRYELYRYEIENDLVDTQSVGCTDVGCGCVGEGCEPPLAPGEEGDYCAYEGAVTDDDERRFLYAAIINCEDYADEMNGHKTNIPIIGIGSFFMTEPVGKGVEDVVDPTCAECSTTKQNIDILRTELVDVTGESGLGTLDDVLREEVVLVR